MVIAPDTDTLVSHLYEWRAPHLEADIKGSEKLIQANSIVEIKIHYIVTTKFFARIKDIRKDNNIEVKYFEEDFLGTGRWSFEPIDEKTKVRYQFQAKPNSILTRFLLRFIDFQKAHSKIMQSGFQGLNKCLGEKDGQY